MVHLEDIIGKMEANMLIFQQLLTNVPAEAQNWRPAPGKWNLKEIVCHLRDEECDDFRRRVQQTLENPQVAPPPIDPEGWVQSRDYAHQDYNAVLTDFLSERRHSLTWLRALKDPDWENAWQHPKFGPLTAGLFLNNWLAHDYLHIRQILQRQFAYLQHVSGENLQYAVEW